MFKLKQGRTERDLDGDENMGEGDPLYRAAHLGLEQWNNIPDNSRIRSSYSHDESDIERKLAYSKVISFLFNFMAEHLTARQFEVIRMYHFDYDLTQDAIAQVLGIAQPTVNQHTLNRKSLFSVRYVCFWGVPLTLDYYTLSRRFDAMGFVSFRQLSEAEGKLSQTAHQVTLI